MTRQFLDQTGLGHLLLSLIQWGKTFVSEAPKDGKLYVRQNGAWVAIETATPSPFVPVTNITGVPNYGTDGTPLTLTATVNPPDATNQHIVWSISPSSANPGSINGNVLTTSIGGTGEVTVRATITNGTAVGTDYTQDFQISMMDASAQTAILPGLWWLLHR